MWWSRKSGYVLLVTVVFISCFFSYLCNRFMSPISQQRFKIFKATILVATVVLALTMSFLSISSSQPAAHNYHSEYTIRIPQLFILDDLYTNQLLA